MSLPRCSPRIRTPFVHDVYVSSALPSLVASEHQSLLLHWKSHPPASYVPFKLERFDHPRGSNKGKGVKATVDIPAHRFVIRYYGQSCSAAEAKEKEDYYSRVPSDVGCYMFYLRNGSCIDATIEESSNGASEKEKIYGDARLVNHSKEHANLFVQRINNVTDYDRITRTALIFVSKRNIAAGEELLIDYGDRDKRSIGHHPWLDQ